MEAKVNLKAMSGKQKLEYIWDYYKIAIIFSIIAIYAVISGVYNYVTEKECIMNIIMVNGSIPYDGAIFADEFLQTQGYDPKSHEIVVSSVGLSLTESTYQQDYYTVQALIARLTSGKIDMMSATPEIFKEYATEGYFANLNDIFTEEELALYQDSLVFTTDLETSETYPCAFSFTNSSWIKEHGYYSQECQFGILYNCDNITDAKNLLLYILNY